MEHYSQTAVERAMKVHEVIMRAMSKEIAWFQPRANGVRTHPNVRTGYVRAASGTLYVLPHWRQIQE
jgi:hypothetical protein